MKWTKAKAVFCIASTETQAEKMVSDLKRNGFRQSDISVLFPDKTGTTDFAHEKHSKAPEGALSGGAVLGVAAACLGWMAGAGVFTIPGLEPLVAAGPVLGALSGAAIGAFLGAIIGALVGAGIPEYVATRYGGKIRAGNILISVHADNGAQARQAKKSSPTQAAVVSR